MAGPGAEVLRRLGATVVVLPGGEIMPALKSGAIDASEWIGPWLDMAIGLDRAAGYYYYPGFHEPGTAPLGINKRVWESLTPSDRRLFETVAACEYARSLGEFNANNARTPTLAVKPEADGPNLLRFQRAFGAQLSTCVPRRPVFQAPHPRRVFGLPRRSNPAREGGHPEARDNVSTLAGSGMTAFETEFVDSCRLLNFERLTHSAPFRLLGIRPECAADFGPGGQSSIR